MLTAILNAIAAIGRVFGYADNRSNLRNAQDVKDAKIQQTEVNQVSQDTKAVADRDLAEVRRRFSE